MAINQNIARLRHLLKNFTVSNLTATNLTATTTALNTVTLSGPNTNGLEGVKLSATTSCIGTTGDYEVAIEQPANTTLLEVGIFFSEACDASGNYVLDVGTAAGGQQIVANTTIVSSNTVTVNTGVSTGGMKNEADAALAFVANYAHHVTSATDIHFSLATGGTNTTGYYKAYIKYIYM